VGSQVDPVPVAPAFTPSTDVPLTGQEAFDELQRALEASPNQIDAIVAADPPKPVGRSWAFDWHTRRFVKPTGAQGPKPTFGRETLTQWIEKAMRTARGAHAVHPLTYGMREPQGGLYGRSVGEVPPDLEQIIIDALTFHWAISDVTDFAFGYDPDEEWLSCAFTVQLSDATAIRLLDVRVTVAP
jgi:hypothetical protein